MHQQHFAGPQLCAIEHVAPYGKQGFRQRRGLDQGKPIGDRQALARGYRHVLGVAAAIGQRADAVAHIPTFDALSDCGNLPGHFQAHNRRCAGRRWIKAHALDDIRPVDAGRGHSDQDLSRCGHRLVAIGQLHRVRPAVFRQIDKSHRLLRF